MVGGDRRRREGGGVVAAGGSTGRISGRVTRGCFPEGVVLGVGTVGTSSGGRVNRSGLGPKLGLGGAS